MNNQEKVEQMIKQNIAFMKICFHNVSEDQRVIAYERLFKREMRAILKRLNKIKGIQLENFKPERLDYKRLMNIILETIPDEIPEKEKVNGWSNPETYQVSILLDNDLYKFKEDLVKESTNWIKLSNKLKEFFYETKQEALDDSNRLAVRLIISIGSLYRVNFDELSKYYIEKKNIS